MKKLLTALVIIVSFGTAGSVYAQDFDKGLRAAQSGDFVTALKEWTALAEQGNASAQYGLGFKYRKGIGVVQDNVYAHMWFNIAASNGNQGAMKGRDMIAKQMTAADISKAQGLARACVEKKFKGC